MLLLVGAQSATVFSLTTDYADSALGFSGLHYALRWHQPNDLGPRASTHPRGRAGVRIRPLLDEGKLRGVRYSCSQLPHLIHRPCQLPRANCPYCGCLLHLYIGQDCGDIWHLSSLTDAYKQPLFVYSVRPCGDWKTEGDSLYMEFKVDKRHMEFLPELSTFTASDPS